MRLGVDIEEKGGNEELGTEMRARGEAGGEEK